MPALVARLADPRRPPSFHAALSLLAGEPAAADAVLGARFDALAAVAQQAAVPSHPDAYHGLLILTGVFATAHDRGGDEAREVAERLARERSLLASLAERAGAGPEAAGEATWEAIVQVRGRAGRRRCLQFVLFLSKPWAGRTAPRARQRRGLAPLRSAVQT